LTIEAGTKTALILGSTGQTGRHLLRELIACPTFSRVCEAGRRVTPAEDLASLQGREKLEQKVVDFERLDEAGLEGGQWDVVFIAYVCSFCFASASSGPS
jgi:oxidoreductase